MNRRDLLRYAGGALAAGATAAIAGCSSSGSSEGTYVDPDGTVGDGTTTAPGTGTTPGGAWSAFQFEEWKLVETDGGRAAVRFTVANATDEHNAVTFVFYVGLKPAATTATGTETTTTTDGTGTVTSSITTSGTAVCQTAGGKQTVDAPYVVARKRVDLDGGASGTFRAVFPVSWETFNRRLDGLCTSRENLAHPP